MAIYTFVFLNLINDISFSILIAWNMTFLTVDFSVFAFQREVRFIVIKIPREPVFRVMTTFTIRKPIDRELFMVYVLMALVTFLIQAFEYLCWFNSSCCFLEMAGGTIHLGMGTFERPRSPVVIKSHCGPGICNMAAFALIAGIELRFHKSLVDVLVTIDAFRSDFSEGPSVFADMTGEARCCQVPSVQRES